MDTRSKILPPKKARQRLSEDNHASVLIARGSFDILQAEHCARLIQEKGSSEKLVVLVSGEEVADEAVADDESADAQDPRRTVLDAGTRAELVAALEVVDYVIICSEAGAKGFISSLSPARVIEPETPPLRDIRADVLRRSQSG
jgi:bifunctional ADP-heptose synthase (sugar kinase/adenylyltransferase)